MDSQQKSDSSTRKLVLIFVLVVIATLTITFLSPFILGYMSPYRQFARKTDRYYSELAGACDLILQQHPLGTNTFISIPVNEAGIPKVIKGLDPTKIRIEPNRVWIGVGETRPGFGLDWELDEGRLNYWRLTTYADGLERTWYSETKPNSQHGISSFPALFPVHPTKD